MDEAGASGGIWGGQAGSRGRECAMSAAPAVIRAAAEIAARGTGRAVVGITGPVGSGKSTLAGRLSACVVSTDDYLPDYDKTPEHLRDLPEQSDLSRLLEDLRALRAGGRAMVPRWCFQEHRRIGERAVEVTGGLIVVEGLHALHEAHAGAVDVRVYVDAPAAVRWARWEHLERTGVRGWGVEYARRFFDGVAEPTFARYRERYRAAADVIVINAEG